MAVTGTVSTYDLTAGVVVNMEAMISLISPFDVPLLGTYGADGRTTLSRETTFAKKVEWLDEDLLTPRSTVAATMTTSEGVLTVATGDRAKFQTDDIVLVDSESLRITGYGTTADTLLVAHAWSGSSAQHVSPAVVVGVGNALPEGSDPNLARANDRTARDNITQIFEAAVKVSGTENVVRKYGLPTSEFDYQVGQRTKEQYIAMEQAILYGKKVDDTTNERRSMGGFIEYITTNVDSTTTDLTESKFLDQIQTAFNAGGAPDRLVVNFNQKRKLSALNSTAVRYGQMDNVRSQTVDFIDTDAGRVTIVLDRWARTSDAFLFSRDQATLATLRPFGLEMLAKTGDSVHGMVLGEHTLKFRKQTHAARWSNLS